MRIALVEELRRLVPFGSYVWAMTDPVTEVAIAPLAVVPDEAVAELPRLIRLRYLTTVNRWTVARCEGRVAAPLDERPPRQQPAPPRGSRRPRRGRCRHRRVPRPARPMGLGGPVAKGRRAAVLRPRARPADVGDDSDHSRVAALPGPDVRATGHGSGAARADRPSPVAGTRSHRPDAAHRRVPPGAPAAGWRPPADPRRGLQRGRPAARRRGWRRRPPADVARPTA